MCRRHMLSIAAARELVERALACDQVEQTPDKRSAVWGYMKRYQPLRPGGTRSQ